MPRLISGFGGCRPRLSATLASSSSRKRAENHSEVTSITSGLQPNEGVWCGVGGAGQDLSGWGDKDAHVGLIN